MKVCIALEHHLFDTIGGAEYQAHLLALEIASRPGVEVFYLCRGTHSPGEESLPYRIVRLGTARGIRRRAVVFDTATLWKTLKRLAPDVIYQRTKLSYTGVCSAYARRAGIPMVYHTALENDLIRSLRRFSVGNFVFDVAESVMGNWGIQHASQVIVQTTEQTGLLRKNFRREPTLLVKNFQPLPAALPRKANARTRVLWVANIKPFKRPEVFVQLAERFRDRSDVEFIMVGTPSKHRRYVNLEAETRALPNFRFLGRQPLEEVNRLLESADLFVNTSLHEGFPNTYIQAWARGAVVASLGVDIDEGMRAQGVGFCCGDFEELHRTVAELADSAARRAAVAARAFEWVHSQHSMQNAARLTDLMLHAASTGVSSAPTKKTPAL